MDHDGEIIPVGRLSNPREKIGRVSNRISFVPQKLFHFLTVLLTVLCEGVRAFSRIFGRPFFA